MKNLKMDRWERLLSEPTVFIPDPDENSWVPVQYQSIGCYSLNEKGIHAFSYDTEGNLLIDTIYSIPFIARLKPDLVTDIVILTFFVGIDEVKEYTKLDCNATKFHSLTARQQKEIDRYISYCILKDLK